MSEKIPIVIATTPGRGNWLNQCLESIGDRQVIVVSDYSYELGKINWIFNNTTIDRFLLLQDSVVVKKQEFFDLLEQYPKSLAISDCPILFGMYLGIYSRETLSKINIPIPKSKDEAIHYEQCWSKEYCATEEVPLLFNDFKDQLNKGTKDHFGRINLILENDYLIKYKGTWSF